jgi:hypothetical protein
MYGGPNFALSAKSVFREEKGLPVVPFLFLLGMSCCDIM